MPKTAQRTEPTIVPTTEPKPAKMIAAKAGQKIAPEPQPKTKQAPSPKTKLVQRMKKLALPKMQAPLQTTQEHSSKTKPPQTVEPKTQALSKPNLPEAHPGTVHHQRGIHTSSRNRLETRRTPQPQSCMQQNPKGRISKNI